jgi:hypothetical protein
LATQKVYKDIPLRQTIYKDIEREIPTMKSVSQAEELGLFVGFSWLSLYMKFPLVQGQ